MKKDRASVPHANESIRLSDEKARDPPRRRGGDWSVRPIEFAGSTRHIPLTGKIEAEHRPASILSLVLPARYRTLRATQAPISTTDVGRSRLVAKAGLQKERVRKGWRRLIGGTARSKIQHLILSYVRPFGRVCMRLVRHRHRTAPGRVPLRRDTFQISPQLVQRQ